MIRRTTWVVLVIFAFLVAVLVFWRRSQENKPAEPTATAAGVSLFEADADIVHMRLEKVGERVVELQRNDQGSWELTWPEGQETDVNAVQTTVPQLLSLRTLSTLQKAPDLKAIGLDPAVYRLLFVLGDGREIVLNVGSATPTGSGYYLLVSGHPLYTVSKYSMDTFLGLVDSPPIVPASTPNPETTTEIEGESAPATAAP